jgi:hypothetical protein
MSTPVDPCAIFGHSWVIRVRNGHLVEICSTCKQTPSQTEREESQS